MSNTRWARLSGEVKWAKVHKPDQKYGHYAIDVKLEGDQLEAFKKCGLMNRISEDGWVQFRRKPSIMTRKGEQVDFGAPEVKDAEGNPFTEDIGNGSYCSVDLAIYDTPKGPGHRLDTVWVLKHVEYIADTRPKFTVDENGNIKVQAKAPN